MEVTVSIPDVISKRIGKDAEQIPRWLLERAGLAAYKSGEISTHDLRLLLGFRTRMQLDAFLKEHGVFLAYDEEDLAHDAETSRIIRQAQSK
jgi:hypothetical protein